MATLSLEEAKEAIYESLKNDNLDIDIHILALKDAMEAYGVTEANFDPQKLSQNNRSGRKMMQSYFKKRGVKVIFES
ncbi:MAG: hypothetical protein JKY71_09860 [Alphaproteobacteria bacterium]|nr:hypothetical protein [Alphaproteobacteria bacterium]